MTNMVCMHKKIPRTWGIDQDVAESFDDWQSRTRTPKGEAAQLGLWIIMAMPAELRESLFALMDARKCVQMKICDPTPGDDTSDGPALAKAAGKALSGRRSAKRSKGEQVG